MADKLIKNTGDAPVQPGMKIPMLHGADGVARPALLSVQPGGMGIQLIAPQFTRPVFNELTGDEIRREAMLIGEVPWTMDTTRVTRTGGFGR